MPPRSASVKCSFQIAVLLGVLYLGCSLLLLLRCEPVRGSRSSSLKFNPVVDLKWRIGREVTTWNFGEEALRNSRHPETAELASLLVDGLRVQQPRTTLNLSCGCLQGAVAAFPCI